jgi:hypothetical protein
MNEERKDKCRLQKKINITASKSIVDMVLRRIKGNIGKI